MFLRTFGHACLAIEEKINKPLLVTDPWLVGSCYFNSWFLENYPSEGETEYLKRTDFMYFTHEHPDHFHTESIDLFPRTTRMIVPDYPTKTMKEYLVERGFEVIESEKFKWKRLSEKVSLLVIPVLGEDSILLVRVGDTLIVNQNDAPISKRNIDAINFSKDKYNIKKTILLRSYSNPSSLNSFFINNKRVKIIDKVNFLERVKGTCDEMAVDFYIPFASQAIFLHERSKWANEYRVSVKDFEESWNIETKLLPPYVTLNFDTFSYESLESLSYSRIDHEEFSGLEASFFKESSFKFSEEDLFNIKKGLSNYRIYFLFGLIKNMSFLTPSGEVLSYSFVKDEISREAVSNSDIVLKVSGQIIRDVFRNNHIEDIGLCQLCEIHLKHQFLKKVHFFQMFLFFHVLSRFKAYGYFRNFRSLINMLRYFFFSSNKIGYEE